ncbi:MAG: hypothetical protein OHK0046_47240 [Anaerolineae bacterium]
MGPDTRLPQDAEEIEIEQEQVEETAPETENSHLVEQTEKPAADAPQPKPKPEAPAKPTEQQPDRIRDPEAYARSVEEKFTRLLEKETQRREAAEQQLEAMKLQLSEDTDKQYKDVIAQLQTELAEARKMKLEAVRFRALAAHGLGDDMIEFLTADNEEGIQTQAEKLAAKVKPNTQQPEPEKKKAPVTKPTNPAAPTKEQLPTLEDIASWTPVKVAQNLELVNKVLAANKQ